MRFPLQSIDEIKLDHPEQWMRISSIDVDSIVSDFGKFCWNLNTSTPGQLLYHRSFQLDSTYISKAKYCEFKNFVNRVALSDQRLVLFSKSDNDVR